MYLVKDTGNICQSCDTTCSPGQCSLGANASNCTICDTIYFMSTTKLCVLPTKCGTG